MTANQYRASFTDFLRAAFEDLADDFLRKVGWHTKDIHRQCYLTTHGIHIAQGIRRGNGTEVIGVIHDWSKEIQCLDNGNIVVDFVDGSIIAYRQPNHQIGIRLFGK